MLFRKRFFKRIFFLLLAITSLLVLAYYLQPIKKGEGKDTLTRYERVANWPALPKEIKLGNPTGIAIDTNGQLIIFHRGSRRWPLIGAMPRSFIKEKTVLLIDPATGKLLSSWGDNMFIMPHGLKVDHENNIWVTDVGLHQVFKFSHDGKLMLKLGEAGVAGRDSLHFNKPTDIAVAKDGSFYISDGYGNNRIMKFSSTGKYLFNWGQKGSGPGEFNIPHGIALDSSQHLYVADRENNRVQVFNSSGKFIRQFKQSSFGTIGAVAFDQTGSRLFAVDDFTFLKIKHRGSDLFIFDTAGQVQTRFGRSGGYDGPTAWYHDLAIDKEGNIYIGDILHNTIQKFRKSRESQQSQKR